MAGAHLKELARTHYRSNRTVTVALSLLPVLGAAAMGFMGRPLTLASFAMAAVLAALLAPVAFSLTDAAPFAGDENARQSFFATTGWSPLAKFTGWFLANLRVQLPLIAVLGGLVVLYGAAGAVFPGLGIEVYPRYLPGQLGSTPVASSSLPQGMLLNDLREIAPRVLLLWLGLPVMLTFLNSVRFGLEVYIGNELVRKGLTILFWVLIFPLGVIYVHLLHAGGVATVSEVMAGSTTPLSLVPDLLIFFLAPVLLALQPLFLGLRSWFSRAVIWFLPGYLVLWVAMLVLLLLTGFYGAAAWLVETPVLMLPLELLQPFYLMLNPFTGAEALLMPNDPASIWLVSESFTGDQLRPELHFPVEPLLLSLILFWTAGLLVHTYLGFRNRCYGRNPWR